MPTPVTPLAPDSDRTSFRSLLGAVDRPFLILDAASRLPTAMIPLGILLYVADRTDSYATGGIAVAALSVGGGLGGSVVGLGCDRFGQRLVGGLVTTVHVLALVAFLVLAPYDVLPVTLGITVLIGLTNPQSGAMARSRWAMIARPRPDRRSFTTAAMAWEGALDESSFVLGPVLVSTVAALTKPALGLGVALVVAAVAQGAFALHRTALPGRGPGPKEHHQPRAPLPRVHVGCLLVAMGAIGLVFGATQTGIAARMSLAGTAELTGPVYAVMGFGSAVAGLLTTRLPQRFSLETRIAVGGAMVVLGGLVAWVAEQSLLLALACLLLGVALAPALTSSYALAERAAPAGWTTTMMTALGTASVVGAATGAAIAGLLVDRVSTGGALLVNVAAGALVLTAGVAALIDASPATPTRSSAGGS